MPKALLGWEIGGGLGHIERLLTIAVHLRECGWELALAVSDRTQAQIQMQRHRCLQGCELVEMGNPVSFDAPRQTPHSLADILAIAGWTDAVRLQSHLDRWHRLIERSRPSVAVADYAPGLTLAAREAGLPCIAASFGFAIPPPRHPLPATEPWRPDAESNWPRVDDRVIDTINRRLAHKSAAGVAGVAEALATEPSWITAPPALDYYDRPGTDNVRFGPIYGSGSFRPSNWAAASSPKVVAYLSAHDPQSGLLIHCLLRAGARVLAFLPGADFPAPPPGLFVSRQPIDIDWAAREADLAVCHGGLGVTQAMLLAGTPCFAMPRAGDQMLLAYRLARQRLVGVIDRKRLVADSAATAAAILSESAKPFKTRRFADDSKFYTVRNSLVALTADLTEVR